MAIKGCNKILAGTVPMVIVGHESRLDYITNNWRQHGNKEIVAKGVLLTNRNTLPSDYNPELFCGWVNEYVTDLCLPCAKRLGYLW